MATGEDIAFHFFFALSNQAFLSMIFEFFNKILNSLYKCIFHTFILMK